MKDMRKGVCAVCDHNEVITAPAMEYSGKFHRAVPLAVTHGKTDVVEPIASGRDKDVDRPVAKLQMLVCRKCGFVQWFAQDPHTIPIDAAHGIALIHGPDHSAYR